MMEKEEQRRTLNESFIGLAIASDDKITIYYTTQQFKILYLYSVGNIYSYLYNEKCINWRFLHNFVHGCHSGKDTCNSDKDPKLYLINFSDSGLP